MEVVTRFSVPNGYVWFVQGVLTDCEGQAVVSLGEREADRSIMSVLYDSSAETELVPLFAYLASVGKIEPVSHDKP